MKRNLISFFSLLTLIGLTTTGCLKDKCEQEITYLNWVPVTKTAAEIQQPIETLSPQPLENPGKIYFYGKYVLINELRKGIHVIDNTDPANPLPVSFISIPGNVDMAVSNDLLYADNYTDLLTIDLSDPHDAQQLSRSEMVFPPLWEEAPGNFVVYMDPQVVTEVVDCKSGRTSSGFFVDDLVLFAESGDIAAPNSSQNGNTGIGGSMARFTIAAGHLYTVNEADLRVFDLSQPTAPSLVNTIGLGWGIETIFPYEDKLFIGSNSGMFIFDNSQPASPTELSRFAHVTACDPVFVKDNFAYVTLRNGTACQGFENQLDLIDISDLSNPQLEKSFGMDNPHGLSIRDNDLYLCEGDFGLKVFDISDPVNLDDHQIDHRKDLHAYDVIAIPGASKVIMVIGEDGFYQYDASKPDDLQLLSKIGVGL